jgi:SAM-dependent methyltransferase
VDTAVAFVKKGTDYSECRACGFQFCSPDVNRNLTNTIADFEAAYLWYLGPHPSDAPNFASLRRWMERFRPLRAARLLDVGAGSGKLVRAFRECGAAAEGLEPSRALFDHFLAGDAAFTCSMLDSYRRLGAQRFDLVTAFDVIEHVAEPLPFLEDVAALLEPGGFFFASTPNAGSVTAKAFGKHWHFYYPYHLSYFSPSTLKDAAARCGLALVDVRHPGRRRSLGYVLRYIAEFIGGRAAPGWASRFDSWSLPINLFDVMYVCFRREPA